MINIVLRSSHQSAGSILSYDLVSNDVRSKVGADALKMLPRTNICKETLNRLLGGSIHTLKSSLGNDLLLVMSHCSITCTLARNAAETTAMRKRGQRLVFSHALDVSARSIVLPVVSRCSRA
jgi:hypothetical protein